MNRIAFAEWNSHTERFHITILTSTGRLVATRRVRTSGAVDVVCRRWNATR